LFRERLKNTTSPVRRVSASDSGIHEAQHQHIAAARILDDGGYQPAAFLKVDLHGVFS